MQCDVSPDLLSERRSLNFVCLTPVNGRIIASFFCLQQGSVVSWACCADSWRFFFSIFEVFVHVMCIYFFFNSKDSYVPCYVLEIQESKASLLPNFASPRAGLRKWGWCGRNWHRSPVHRFKAQGRCRVGKAVPATTAVHLRSTLFCTFVVKKKPLPGINFQGRIQSSYQE